MNAGRIACAFAVAAALAATAKAQPFPVLQGDPVDGLGRALPILPGVPLIGPNEGGDFNPPVIDPNTIGDVDLVARAGHVTPGATMPPPALVPPVAAAGGSRFPGGTDIPFTVIASDGDPLVPGGHPLPGPELDGIPVVVMAWADLDRDGFVGPTDADADGAADYGRELQESGFPVGVRVAYFANGVAQGVIASDVGAPASAGGLPVVLTAAAYVGQFSPEFFGGTVPDGPAIATLLPFFPRLDPDRVIDTDGSAGPGLPDGRIAVEVESEFDPVPSDPVLGAAFALPTDGSSVTIDRAFVTGAAASGARFVRPARVALTGDEPRLPLRPGAGGVLFEPLAEIVDLPVDGPGNGLSLQLVPVDVLGNVTDPTAPLMVDLIVSNDVAITSPDTDGDPSRETLSVTSGAGMVITLDDAVDVGGHASMLDLEVAGARIDRLIIDLAYGPLGNPPLIFDVALEDGSEVLALDCPRPKTLVASIFDGDGDATSVTATVFERGLQVGDIDFSPTSDPTRWVAPLPLPSPGALDGYLVIVTARDSKGNTSPQFWGEFSVVESLPPAILDVTVSPSPLAARKRTRVVVSARFVDGCGVAKVAARMRRGERMKRFGRLNDRGKKGDAVAGDATFTARRRVRVPNAETFVVEVTAANPAGDVSTVTASVPILP